MTFAVMQMLELVITVGGVFARFLGLAFGLLWMWNH